MGSPDAQKSSVVKVLTLRREAVCGCGAQLPVGTRAVWDRSLRIVVCMNGLDLGPHLRVSSPSVSTGEWLRCRNRRSPLM
jgi:hypothetical protein